MFCLLGWIPALCQPRLDTASISQINQKVTEFMAKTSSPGISVAIVKNGEFVWANGYGMADLENNVPATNETEYRLGSVSKPLSATGAMWLVEHGKLDLDAPVQKYCPAFPQKKSPITTREVLSHTAGIRHYKSDSRDDPDISSTKHYDSIHDALKVFANDDLVAEPGTKFNYSTFGYTLLGCVIEGASGQKYIDFMQRTIFAPSGMTHTQDDDEHRIIAHRAQGYQKDERGGVINSELADTSYKVPGGGLISNVEDMARFEAALLNNKLLRTETRQQMWSRQAPSADPKRAYGFGWGMSDLFGFPTVGHAGAQQRVTTAIIIQPEHKAGVVVLCNMENVDTFALAAELLRIVVGEGSPSPAG